MSDPVREHSSTRRAHWDERHAAGGPAEGFEPDPNLVDEIGSLPPGRALDLGAGSGRNAIWLAGRGWRVTAVDFSQVALDRGRELATARDVRVDWQLADLMDWTPGAGEFDLVMLFFIHLPPADRRDVYARAAAAVAPGGTLLIVGHDRTNLVDGVGGPQDQDVLFTPNELAAELGGFAIERADVVRRAARDGRPRVDAILRAVKVAPGGAGAATGSGR